MGPLRRRRLRPSRTARGQPLDRVVERTSKRPPLQGDLNRDLSSTVTLVRLPHCTQRYTSIRRVTSSGLRRESTQS